jgi:hypothetical protein
VIPSVAGVMTNLSEEQVAEKAFELIMAFDEVSRTPDRSILLFICFIFPSRRSLRACAQVITAGGYREPITLAQIKTNMEMESHEEKLHNMIKISKIESAKDQAAVAARAIKDKQKEQSRMAGMGSGMGGGGSGRDFGGDSSDRSNSFSFNDTPTSAPTPAVAAPSSASASRARQPVKGMSLNPAGAKNKSAEDALMREDKLAPLISTSKSAASSEAPSTMAAAVAQQPITLSVVEKVTAKLSRDGLVELFEIKGSLTLTAADDEAALCSVQLKMPTSRDSIFSFNTHPKVNKAAYEKSAILQLKEANKGFPSARPVGILKWTHSGTSDDLVPLKINCWPEEEARGQMNVSIEYSMDVAGMELHDVRITIPLGTNAAPSIINVDGSHKHNASTGELVWRIDLIDKSNSSGSLEFNVQQRDAEAFFPISVQFASQKLYSSVEVLSVLGANGAPIVYGLSKSMSSEEYEIK